MTKTTPLIDIRPDHWDIVQGILQKHVPQHEVWAFGSRAKWSAKQYSDLDLAIITDKPLSLDISASLSDDFSESDLPYKVDIVDWATTSESFRKIVERDKVVVQRGISRAGIASEWQTLTVDQIKAKGDRSIVIGPFGSRMKANTYVETGVPVIRGNNISDTREFVGDFVYVSEKMANELRSCNVFAGDLVFPHRGATGQVGIVPKDTSPRFMLSTSLMKLTCNEKLVDPIFIFYFFRSSLGRYALLQHASTVGTPGIGQPLTSLRSIEIPVPPIKEQRAIAHILGALDDKIELNRKQNETLEAMARALFKAWFVDFEPVRAKMEGRWQRGQSLPGLPAHLYDLFPERLVNSELGEIPEGCAVQRISDVLTLAYGKSLPAEKRNQGDVPVYGSGGITGFHDEFLINGPAIIIGRKGTVGSLYWEERPSFPIDTVFYVQPIYPLHYCFYLLQTLPLQEMNTDAAVPGLNRGNVTRLEVVAHPDALVLAFTDIARQLRESITKNTRKCEILVQLRDALLPKLISGELRVPEVESFIKERGL